MSMTAREFDEVYYPDSDGEPMADNDAQRNLMFSLHHGFSNLYVGQVVYVSANIFWYPVEGEPNTVVAPDVLVAFGRPTGERRSYQQWKEGGIAPQAVFEILSHRSKVRDLLDKRDFYDAHGVDEYYVFDPEDGYFRVWQRRGSALTAVVAADGHRSELLGVHLSVDGTELVVVDFDGNRFLSWDELVVLPDRLDAAQ